jgi:hypothetical protein
VVLFFPNIDLALRPSPTSAALIDGAQLRLPESNPNPLVDHLG